MENKEIQEKFNEVISYSQTGLENPKTDDLFRRWREAKREYYEAFGNKLIYEYPEPLTFELSESEKEHKFRDFIDGAWRWNDNNTNFPFLAGFLKTQGFESFYNNKTKEDFIIGETIIPKGIKIIKSFKYFIKDKEMLNKAQSEASLLIQENKINGILCLSIHPLDFLSASENTYNWRSCHALDGEYRAGNISYMVDKTTVMCYIKSTGPDEKLPNFPNNVKWNSKKWRMWLFFSDNKSMIFAGRQYPCVLMNALNFIKDNMINGLFPDREYKYDWCNDRIKETKVGQELHVLNSPMIYVNRKLVPMSELVEDAPNSLHYNDLLYSTSYIPLYTYETYTYHLFLGFSSLTEKGETILKVTQKDPHFHIGGSFKCLRCEGDEAVYNESLMCKSCELEYGDCEGDDFLYCPWCGNRFAEEDGIWIEGENVEVCPDCAQISAQKCEICGNFYHEDDVFYDEKQGIYICKYCAEEKY